MPEKIKITLLLAIASLIALMIYPVQAGQVVTNGDHPGSGSAYLPDAGSAISNGRDYSGYGLYADAHDQQVLLCR